MRKIWFVTCVFSVILSMVCAGSGFGQNEPLKQVSPQQPAAKTPEPGPLSQVVTIEDLEKTGNVTLDFKEADIRNVLKIISYKAGVNIVTTPEVVGNINIRLVDVPWQKALDVILKTSGFGYEKQGNIITVAPFDKLTAQKKQEVELAEVQPTLTEVYTLKYIDAQDAKKALEPQLSARGKITVLEMTGQSGWEFSATSKGETLAKLKKVAEGGVKRSRVLIISDIPPVLDKIKDVIEQIDVMPRQVLIETRIMEVNRNKLKDIGFDWGTGKDGATTYTTMYPTPTSKKLGESTTQISGKDLSSQAKPAIFNPMSTAITGVYPYNTGLSILFQKLNGTQFEVMLHALEEDVDTNTLSAPRIMALNNQEATILVGTKYPILKQDTTGAGSTAVTTVTLDYYQDIGIQLNVVPQIGENGYVNMVVHPAVSSYTNVLGDNKYPIIDTREAETRILMKDGETIVIGGLLKDVKSKGMSGVPFLSKIPFAGPLFRRDTVDNEKIDLLVFITARIVKEGMSPEEVAKLEDRMNTIAQKQKASVSDKKKKKK